MSERSWISDELRTRIKQTVDYYIKQPMPVLRNIVRRYYSADIFKDYRLSIKDMTAAECVFEIILVKYGEDKCNAFYELPHKKPGESSKGIIVDKKAYQDMKKEIEFEDETVMEVRS